MFVSLSFIHFHVRGGWGISTLTLKEKLKIMICLSMTLIGVYIAPNHQKFISIKLNWPKKMAPNQTGSYCHE